MTEKQTFWQRYGHNTPTDPYLVEGSRHPRCPWWRFVGMASTTPEDLDDPEWMHHLEEHWLRMDGHSLLWDGASQGDVEEALTSYDCKCPREAPLPAVHQVWRVQLPGERVAVEKPVTVVREDDEMICCRLGEHSDPLRPLKAWHCTEPREGFGPWPPEHSILIGGPGAPWVPADWSAE